MRPILFGFIIVQVLPDPWPDDQRSQSETHRLARDLPVRGRIHRERLGRNAGKDQREYYEHDHYFFHFGPLPELFVGRRTILKFEAHYF